MQSTVDATRAPIGLFHLLQIQPELVTRQYLSATQICCVLHVRQQQQRCCAITCDRVATAIVLTLTSECVAIENLPYSCLTDRRCSARLPQQRPERWLWLVLTIIYHTSPAAVQTSLESIHVVQGMGNPIQTTYIICFFHLLHCFIRQ